MDIFRIASVKFIYIVNLKPQYIQKVFSLLKEMKVRVIISARGWEQVHSAGPRASSRKAHFPQNFSVFSGVFINTHVRIASFLWALFYLWETDPGCRTQLQRFGRQEMSFFRPLYSFLISFCGEDLLYYLWVSSLFGRWLFPSETRTIYWKNCPPSLYVFKEGETGLATQALKTSIHGYILQADRCLPELLEDSEKLFIIFDMFIF